MPEQAVAQRVRNGGVASNRSQNGPAQPGQREWTRQLSYTVAYDLWLGSWETALAALAAATQSGTLSMNEAAAHKAAIAAEREVVTRQFTLLLGHTLARRGLADDVSVAAALEAFHAR